MAKKREKIYTTIRFEVVVANKIKSLAKKEGRNIEFIAKRLVEQGLMIEDAK